jgi:hypothetical protein
MGWSDPPVITSIVLAAITFFYLIATLLIWHATWQNTKATRQVLEASHRPYVGVADMRLAVDDLTGDLLLLAKVANVGSVPARHVEVELQLQTQGTTINRQRNASGESGQVALLPGQNFTLRIIVPPEHHPDLNPSSECRTLISIQYSGMSDKKYRTKNTYTYSGNVDFVIASGRFE